ncbi:DUF6314 family protein [Saccharopolyspora taberi]|uniref:DUF6314 family protein n=1 Tax=Saccharopolyspora taberi TaxID=60895 RepID=UPI0031D6E62E
MDDLAGFLAGRWRLEREIVDAAGAPVGSFSGVGVFSPCEGGLEYREDGVLELGSHRGPAFRCLRYLVSGACAQVWFSDGSWFHDLDLRSGRWRVVHPCRADEYRGEFVVLDADRWRQEWRVSGPVKDYAMVTVLRRG